MRSNLFKDDHNLFRGTTSYRTEISARCSKPKMVSYGNICCKIIDFDPAKRAAIKLDGKTGRPLPYNIATDNCQQFASGMVKF